MSVPPPPPAPGPTDDQVVPRPLTAADWRAWADSAVVDLQGAWIFALHCPADPDLRGHVEKVLLHAWMVAGLLRQTLTAMPDAEQSPFPLEIHPPAPDADHDSSPTDPATSRPFTPPR